MTIELKPPKPAAPAASADMLPIRRRLTGTVRLPVPAVGPAPPALPPEQTPAPGSMTGGIQSEPMRQAYRDLARGLQDTGKGAEAGHTYQKLKR